MTAATLGIAALLLANAILFTVIKWCGAAYLAWMGISFLRNADKPILLGDAHRPSAIEHARRGFMISMSNPKAILAYSAIFPQFIDPALEPVEQFLTLVPTALFIVAGVYSLYAALGASVGQWFMNARLRTVFNCAMGGFYLLFALGLTFFDPQGQDALSNLHTLYDTWT